MSRPVQIEFQGLEALQKRLTNPALVVAPAKDFLEEASVIAQKAAIKGVDAGTGIAVRSINREVKPMEARVFSAMSRRRILSIERGRPPGEVPPARALEKWARSVGNPDNGFKIAEGIRQRGVRGRFFMQAAREKTLGELPRLMAKMASAVERMWRR